MQMLSLALLSMFGGVAMLVLTVGIGVGLPRLLGARIDLLEAAVIAAGFFGPATFGLGVAGSFYLQQWLRTREVLWSRPLLLVGVSEMVLLLLLCVRVLRRS